MLQPSCFSASALIYADYARVLERYHRTQSKAFGGRTQRRSVHVDALLGDLAVAQEELVDAAPVEALPAGGTGVLPFDDHGVAAGGPIEQLPDAVRRALLHQLGEPAELLAEHRPVVEW